MLAHSRNERCDVSPVKDYRLQENLRYDPFCQWNLEKVSNNDYYFKLLGISSSVKPIKLILLQKVFNFPMNAKDSIKTMTRVRIFPVHDLSFRLSLPTTRPGLLEAWTALTSVKYHGNLSVLIPLNQWLALKPGFEQLAPDFQPSSFLKKAKILFYIFLC